MNKNLEQTLIKKFPNLYKDYRGDPRTTCMCFGFEVGDGWYKIIEELSEKLEPFGIVAAQVKEKFGGLRFYIQAGNDEAFKAIQEAEDKSYETCEVCGKPGKLRGETWLQTLCDECDNKNNDPVD